MLLQLRTNLVVYLLKTAIANGTGKRRDQVSQIIFMTIMLTTVMMMMIMMVIPVRAVATMVAEAAAAAAAATATVIAALVLAPLVTPPNLLNLRNLQNQAVTIKFEKI